MSWGLFNVKLGPQAGVGEDATAIKLLRCCGGKEATVLQQGMSKAGLIDTPQQGVPPAEKWKLEASNTCKPSLFLSLPMIPL